MNILMIGKLPPTQGGIAVETYGAAKRLRDLGHSVTILTNADATSWHYRNDFSDADTAFQKDDLSGIERISIGRLGNGNHIPFDQSFAVRLFSVGMDLIARRKPDLIVGSYLFPYGFVAAQLSKCTGLPLFLKHAGSDLGRLSKLPDLNTSAKWTFAMANNIFSNVREGSEGRDDLNLLEINSDKIVNMPPRRLPSFFHSAPNHNWNGQDSVRRLLSLYSNELPYDVLAFLSSQLSRDRSSADGALTIGVYGKIGETKGTFDLLSAVQKLKDLGTKVAVRFLVSGTERNWKRLCVEIRQRRLEELIEIYPSVAPWLVPNFIRSCDAIAFLERNFPIKYHSPRLPREVIVAGGVLILSEEVAKKQAFKSNLVNMENCIIVPDPTNIIELSSAIKSILDKENLSRIRTQSRRLGDFIEWSLEGGDAFGDAIHGELKRSLLTM